MTKYIKRIRDRFEYVLYKYTLYLLTYIARYKINTPWAIKTCHFYFLSSSVKHWPNLIIFGVQHQEKT